MAQAHKEGKPKKNRRNLVKVERRIKNNFEIINKLCGKQM